MRLLAGRWEGFSSSHGINVQVLGLSWIWSPAMIMLPLVVSSLRLHSVLDRIFNVCMCVREEGGCLLATFLVVKWK